MKTHGGSTTVLSDHSSSKPKNNKKPKSRDVSSRFLSPPPSSSSSDYGNQSPNNTLLISSPNLNPNPKPSTTSRIKHKSYENSGFFRGLWPSSSPSPNSLKPAADTFLANHQLGRQRSCTEFNRFEINGKNNIYNNNSSAKENKKPVVFGGSMRYTGKFKLPGKSVKSSNYLPDLDDQHNNIIAPGRFSVDENSLRKKSSFSRGLSSDPDDHDTQLDSESEYSDVYSGRTSLETLSAGKYFPASYMAPTVSSRKHGIEVPSKFMHDVSSRSRRWSADSGLNQKPVSSSSSSDNNNDDSPKVFTLKNAMKKANGNWALSPGQSGSSKSALGLRTPTSCSSRGKGVGNILSMGIEILLKGKKSSSTSTVSSLSGPGWAENVHELRLLHNRLVQWRYNNARAEAVNGSVIKHAECSFLFVWNDLIQLQNSVLQKRIQLQKEKLEIKLNYILHYQIKGLENWGNMERQHLSAVCTTIDYLHSVVCRVPLVDGAAKVEPQSTSIAVRHASDLAASINLQMLTTFSPTIEKTVGVVGELARVVTQEKVLLEECFELFRNISILEIQERSLQSSIMQSYNYQLRLQRTRHDA